MSYIIEPMPLISFIEDSKLKLPRFQRKATWDKKQNFGLCISVFQEYPVGVVIVNREQNVSWLLDGRQRRFALKGMRENPVALYDWAKSYLGFKATADEGEITSLYWGKVQRYLSTEDKKEDRKEDNNDEEDSVDIYEGEEFDVENSFDSEKQRQGLTVLLKLVLMVHQIKQNVSRWEKAFAFPNMFSLLKYAPKKENNRVNPVLLRKFLLEYYKSNSDITEETFRNYYEENCALRDNEELNFMVAVNQNWDYLKGCVELIGKSEKIFEDARIGMITLTNVSPLDAQNIFSRMNGGGTLLKAEELLSAKPYWNESVNNVDANTKAIIKEMYRKLEVEAPTTVVRWDLAATLLSRIDSNRLIFAGYGNMLNPKFDIPMDEVTLGFKVLSSVFQGGMSAIDVNNLEKDATKIDWEYDIDKLVDDINKICEILMNDSFFQFFQSWKKPMVKLLGSAITIEFIVILIEDWKKKGRPTVSGTQYKAFQRDARVLFDRLVFEYSTKVWRGSGDSKMSSDIAQWQSRLQPISTAEWTSFINGAAAGEYNGQPIKQKTITPVLYYYYALTDKSPINMCNVSFDVDHIIPQEKFGANNMTELKLKDSLTNLALLPKKDNISKKSKALNEITDAWLKKSISTYSGIQESEFEEFSDISHLSDMQKKRCKMFLRAFDETRTTQLSN